LIDELMEAHYDTLIGTFRFPEENRALLDELRATYRLGLFSNFDHAPPLRQRLARDGLVDWLDPIVVSAELGWRKPGKEAFRKALELAGERPERILFVGDSLSDDVGGACAAGIDCAWVNSGSIAAEWIASPAPGTAADPSRGGGTEETLPTYELRSLTDLTGVLSGALKMRIVP
jgi:HAD superfamily hydrolase (TIGR01549 family)